MAIDEGFGNISASVGWPLFDPGLGGWLLVLHGKSVDGGKQRIVVGVPDNLSWPCSESLR
jgi:hypothetical protein